MLERHVCDVLQRLQGIINAIIGLIIIALSYVLLTTVINLINQAGGI
jgi:type II secretory pathway component PulF